MKHHRLVLSLLSLGFISLPLCGHAAEAGFKSIFNGKDLSGWEGNTKFWSVREGAITGQTTTTNMVDANTFLIWKGGEPKNFEFRAQFRLTAQNDAAFGNSGVQYRSRIIDPANFVVGGYQADIDLGGKYAGMLYEERGRGILMQPGQKIRVNPAGANGKAAIEKAGEPTDAAKLTAAYKKGEWNEIVIIAKGNHVQHFLNGTLTADVTDNDPEKAPKSGVIALQLHKGPPMTIQFKDVKLKMLP
jgi:hypothetical protein